MASTSNGRTPSTPTSHNPIPRYSKGHNDDDQNGDQDEQLFFDLLFFGETFWVVEPARGAEEMKLKIESNGGTLSSSITSATRVIFLKPKDLTECLKSLNELNTMIYSNQHSDGNGLALSEGWINDQLLLNKVVETRPYLVDDKNIFDVKFWEGFGVGVEKPTRSASITRKKKSKKAKTVHFPSSPLQPLSPSSIPDRLSRSSPGYSFPDQVENDGAQIQQRANSIDPRLNNIDGSLSHPPSPISLNKKTVPPGSYNENNGYSPVLATPKRTESFVSNRRVVQISLGSTRSFTNVNQPASTRTISGQNSVIRPTRSTTLRNSLPRTNEPLANLEPRQPISGSGNESNTSIAGRSYTNTSMETTGVFNSGSHTIALEGNILGENLPEVAGQFFLSNQSPQEEVTSTPHLTKDIETAQNGPDQLNIPNESTKTASANDQGPIIKDDEQAAVPARQPPDAANVEANHHEDVKESKVKSESRSAIYNRRYRNQATVQPQDLEAYQALISDLKARVAGEGFPNGGMKAYLKSRGILSLYTKYGALVREEVSGLPNSREIFKNKSQGINPKWQKFIDEQNARERR